MKGINRFIEAWNRSLLVSPLISGQDQCIDSPNNINANFKWTGVENKENHKVSYIVEMYNQVLTTDIQLSV